MLTEICNELKKRGYCAEIIIKKKNNDLQSRSLVVYRPGESTHLVLSENRFSEDDPPEMIAGMIDSAFEKGEFSGFDFSWVDENDQVLENCVLMACRKDWNKELLKNAVWRQIGETDLVWYVAIYKEEGNGVYQTGKIPKGFLGIPEEELFEAAERNSLWTGKLMDPLEVFHKLGIPFSVPEDYKPAMVVLSNDTGMHGAGVALLPVELEYARKALSVKRMAVFPSSIHEVVCTPENTILTSPGMTDEVNRSVVDREEWLSDHPYIWDGWVLKNA